MTAHQESSLELSDLLKECGAVIVDENYPEKADYDLSINGLTKETIIGMFSGK